MGGKGKRRSRDKPQDKKASDVETASRKGNEDGSVNQAKSLAKSEKLKLKESKSKLEGIVVGNSTNVSVDEGAREKEKKEKKLRKPSVKKDDSVPTQLNEKDRDGILEQQQPVDVYNAP